MKIELTAAVIKNMLSAWNYPLTKKITRGLAEDGHWVESNTIPDDFYGEVQFVGKYVRTHKAKWFGDDVFTLASLQIYVDRKLILDIEHPELDEPQDLLETKSTPLPDICVTNGFKPLSEIFKLFGAN